MYKALCLLSFFILFSIYCNGQNVAPGMKWQKSFGGSSSDQSEPPTKISLIARDGGYLIAGNTHSNDGDISGNHKNGVGTVREDIWVAKLDTSRNIKWSISLGGSVDEDLGSLQLAHDSGYILTGFTSSNDGNVSGNHGGKDVWVVRLNNEGKVMWQKCYGGTGFDLGRYIEKTNDGYILLGQTESNDGDVSGNHQSNTNDIWVVKLDKNGNIKWQKCYGGSDGEGASAIKQTPDGGYIIAGTTASTDGDVHGLHVDPYYGVGDIWVVKIDGSGTIEWQKCFGGSSSDVAYDIDISPAGGYVIAGYTNSIDGDLTDNHLDSTHLIWDGWIINISNTGVLQWQKTLGGTQDNEFYDLLLLPDHTFLTTGLRVTPEDEANSISATSCWLVKFNTSGQVIWEKSFQSGAKSWEYGICSALNSNGNIIITGTCKKNGSDLWLFEVGSTNTIQGNTFNDVNSDEIQNNNESFFDKVTIRATKNGQTVSTIPRNGYYKMDVDTGTYIIEAIPNNPYYNPKPVTKIFTYSSFFNVDSVNFAIQSQPGIRDINVNLFSLTPARPGFKTIYQLKYANVGTDIVGTGSIKLKKDTRLSFINATPAPTTINNDTLSWSLNNFSPNNDSTITLTFTIGMPPAVNIGDTLSSKAWVQHDRTDVTPANDTISFKHFVTGSFDPNDKAEAHAGIISPVQVSNGDYLNYLVRFQNKGTDTAFNITVRDTLDKRFDLNTLQMISASHAYQLSVQDGSKLSWQFTNIKLPHEAVDEPGSHGYIVYRIKPLSSVKEGDTIKNSASIYFDYNLPIMTNTEKTIVFSVSVSLPVTLTSFNAQEVGSTVHVTWKTSIEDNLNHFEVQRSSNGIDFSTIGTILSPGKKSYLFVDANSLQGYNYYRLKSVDKDGTISYSGIVMVNVRDKVDIISLVYPNPGKGNITLKLQGAIQGETSIRIIDQNGKPVSQTQMGYQNTQALTIPLNLEKLPGGHYVLQIAVGEKKYLHKLIIQ